jgi:hypothetical protein
VDVEKLTRVATKLRERNEIDREIAGIINRPVTPGHLGEWIASEVFGITLNDAANQKAIDGYFANGPFSGASVNVKWYLKREGILDMSPNELPDYYLVLTGPPSRASSSLGTTRPWRLDAVYLFEAAVLHADLQERGRRIGVASSIRASTWTDAEVYPRERSSFPLSGEQRSVLASFAS